MKCDVCGSHRAQVTRIVSLPGMPITVGKCDICLIVGAYPYWAIVANTICIDGMESAADWWRQEVENSLNYLGISREQFDHDVADGLARESADLRRELADSCNLQVLSSLRSVTEDDRG